MILEGYKIGVNYLPSESFIFFWLNFNESIIRSDFSWLKENSYEVVRIFLLWEAFQPEPKKVDVEATKNLIKIADVAKENGLKLIPTLFVGHLSGINFLPPWVIRKGNSRGNFPIYSAKELRNAKIIDFYKERELRKAQRFLVHEIVSALEGHPAIFAWDLGNEPSNLFIPEVDHFKLWLDDIIEEIKRYEDIPVTLGIHQEDLLRRSPFDPWIIKDFCDFLSMHAYPFYLDFLDSQLDKAFPLFLLKLTQWLATSNKEVVLEEFGAPSKPDFMHTVPKTYTDFKLFEENEINEYLRGALQLVFSSGIRLALLWCFSDYSKALWDKPPFDERIHERFFGLRRWDGEEKIYTKIGKNLEIHSEIQTDFDWIDIEREEYFDRPEYHMNRLFKRFRTLLVES